MHTHLALSNVRGFVRLCSLSVFHNVSDSIYIIDYVQARQVIVVCVFMVQCGDVARYGSDLHVTREVFVDLRGVVSDRFQAG